MGSASGGYRGARCHGNKSPGDRELSQLFPRLLFCGELANDVAVCVAVCVATDS